MPATRLSTRLNTTDFLRGVSTWFEGREAADGGVQCPRHRIEHTGKIVYAAAIDLELLQLTDEDRLRERIRLRALRTLQMVREDPNTGSTVFFPGSLDAKNAASNLIDSGACCDVLSEILLRTPEIFSEEERQALRAAVTAVCETYLMKAVLVKEVPAQRLWGATGLARASVALDRKDFGEGALEGIRRAIAQSNADGSIPYIPEPEKHNEHVGLADISTYYHSRHLGFMGYIHRILGIEPEPEIRAFMRKGLEFLCALYGREGIKPLVNEAKQWYWESAYEVVSHSFDVHALIEGYRIFEDPRYLYLARLSLDRLLDHVAEDGGVISHHGDEINFQCRDFWNGHVAWIARVRDEIPDALPPEPPSHGTAVFDVSGIVRVDRPDYTAILRGKKQPINISFGGDAGGGTMFYFGRRERGFVNDILLPKWTSQAPGNFVVTPDDRPSFKKRVMSFYRDNRHDMRFRLYIANIERKAGNTKKALEYPLRHVVAKLRDEMKGRYASHFDVSPSLSINGDEVVFSSMLARRDGTVLRGSSLTRRFRFGDAELLVEEVLALQLPVRAALYERIAAAIDFQIESDAPYRTNGASVMFQPRTYPCQIRITYRL